MILRLRRSALPVSRPDFQNSLFPKGVFADFTKQLESFSCFIYAKRIKIWITSSDMLSDLRDRHQDCSTVFRMTHSTVEGVYFTSRQCTRFYIIVWVRGKNGALCLPLRIDGLSKWFLNLLTQQHMLQYMQIHLFAELLFIILDAKYDTLSTGKFRKKKVTTNFLLCTQSSKKNCNPAKFRKRIKSWPFQK